jgi:antitoxin component YwqK of YwqJK toxin-antitoxin module
VPRQAAKNLKRAMPTMKKSLFFVLLLSSGLLWAQAPEPKVQEGQFTFDTDKPFTLLELEKEEEPIVTKKKKPKRRVFYGIKTKKGFTRKGFGNNVTLELFYKLKKPDVPNTFARDIYWYDFTRREIRHSEKFDPKKGVLLHGPYKKLLGNTIVEEGLYYKGTKHGRWMRHNKQDLLEDKEKYYKGWPKESRITYYDPAERKKPKEITPVEYGEKEGYYYLLHENGQVAVRGEYRFNEKVNDWIENYPNGKRKRIITYPKEPFEKDIKPYVRKEWDDRGKEIYSK